MSEQPSPRARGTGTVRPKDDPAKALLEHRPWIPVTCPPEAVIAIQALRSGTADPQQQRTALEWILEMSRNGGADYFPGEDGRRDTDFALGRGFVAKMIYTVLNIKLRRGEHG